MAFSVLLLGRTCPLPAYWDCRNLINGDYCSPSLWQYTSVRSERKLSLSKVILPGQISDFSVSSVSSVRTCWAVSHLRIRAFQYLFYVISLYHYLPKQRSRPPINAIAWSITHIFSCCKSKISAISIETGEMKNGHVPSKTSRFESAMASVEP